MISHEEVPADHCGLDCPQCQAMSQTARILGGLALAMEKALKDGMSRRLGAEAARRREEAFWKTFLGV